ERVSSAGARRLQRSGGPRPCLSADGRARARSATAPPAGLFDHAVSGAAVLCVVRGRRRGSGRARFARAARGGGAVMKTRALPLRYAADARTIALLTVLTALFVLQYAHLVEHRSLLLLTYAFVLVPLVAKHNHNHCRTFRSRRWNTA